MNKKFIYSIVVITVILVAGLIGYAYWNKDTGPVVRGEWKTYQNTQRGFEIQYPDYLQVKEDPAAVLFANVEIKDPKLNQARALISVLGQSKPITIEQLSEEAKEVAVEGSVQVTTINGLQVLRYTISDFGISANILNIIKDNNVYVMEFPDSESVDQIPKIPDEDMNRMIESFKFTN